MVMDANVPDFELNRYFGGHERWGPLEIERRARDLFKLAIQRWPRPEIAASFKPLTGTDSSTPAALHGDCVKLAQRHLGIRMSKLAQTRYGSAMDAFARCAFCRAPTRNRGTFHTSGSRSMVPTWNSWKLRNLRTYLGFSSGATTLLVAFSAIRSCLDLMGVTKNEDRRYWHIVIRRKMGRFVLRLLRGNAGPTSPASTSAAELRERVVIAGRAVTRHELPRRSDRRGGNRGKSCRHER